MQGAEYIITRKGKYWGIRREDGSVEGSHMTKEGAFEAAVLAASNAIKQGQAIAISVPAPAPGETAIGGPA
jgi:hypothetical protein